MELQIEQSVMSLRKTVHYILLQAKKESDNFRRDDLAVAIKKLTKITDTLAQATNNAPPALQCISTAKRLAFSAMKYLQVKHSGQNFIVQETEFKKDIALFKNHYTLLMNYCEKTGWKISEPPPKSTTPPDTKSQSTGTNTPHHSGSHQMKKTPINTPGSQPLVKALSEPANARFYSESKSPESHGLMSSTERESPSNTTHTPPGRSSNNQTPVSHGSRVRNNNSPSHYERTSHQRTDSFDEWDSIEKELLGTIEEDNIITTAPISDRPSTSIRTSIVSERSDLLELLIQQGLTPEMILNSTEEELLLVLEQSLLSDNNSMQPKKKRQSTQDLEDRLAFLEKQLLGDLF